MNRVGVWIVGLVAMGLVGVVVWQVSTPESAIEIGDGAGPNEFDRTSDERLAEEVAKLTGAVRHLVSKLDAHLDAGVGAMPGGLDSSSQQGPRTGTTDVDDVTKLRAAMEMIVQAADRLHSDVVAMKTAGETTRIRYDSPARDLRALWRNEEDAKKCLVLRTYADIARIVGTPDEIHCDGNYVKWQYDSGVVKFVDGYVASVSMYAQAED